MTTAIVSEPHAIRTLDARTSTHLLDEACRLQRSVELRPAYSGAGFRWSGTLTDIDSETLTIACDPHNGKTEELAGASTLTAAMSVQGTDYLFATRYISYRPTHAIPTICIRRPGTIAAIERRRSRRRALYGNTDVTLHAPSDVPPWFCTATLLNLSLEGLACLAGERDMRRVDVGSILGAEFQTSQDGPKIALGGRVVGITQAGSPGRLVVGMEFTDTDEHADARAELEAALEQSNEGGDI